MAGLRNADKRKVTIAFAKGHSLWLLDFTNIITRVAVHDTCKKQLGKDGVLLQTELDGKKYFILIALQAALNSDIFG